MNISDKVLICNDSSILFREAFWHHTTNEQNIAIISNNFKLMKVLIIEYANKHYQKRYEFNIPQMILKTPHGNIYILSHKRMTATGILIHKGFILQDTDYDISTEDIIKVITRCRI